MVAIFWTVFGYKCIKFHAFITKCTILWNFAVKLLRIELIAWLEKMELAISKFATGEFTHAF